MEMRIYVCVCPLSLTQSGAGGVGDFRETDGRTDLCCALFWQLHSAALSFNRRLRRPSSPRLSFVRRRRRSVRLWHRRSAAMSPVCVLSLSLCSGRRPLSLPPSLQGERCMPRGRLEEERESRREEDDGLGNDGCSSRLRRRRERLKLSQRRSEEARMEPRAKLGSRFDVWRTTASSQQPERRQKKKMREETRICGRWRNHQQCCCRYCSRRLPLMS